jgi:hypothetical protein
MDLDVRELIANLPAVDSAQSARGPLMGHNTANAIAAAFDEAGYVILNISEFEKFLSVREMGIEDVTDANQRPVRMHLTASSTGDTSVGECSDPVR